jgi:nitrite reductase/ring-hydroxylating ferredoxin subunit
MAEELPRRIDAALNDPGREGLTGTAPGSAYAQAHEREEHTLAPDGRPMGLQPKWRRDFPIDWPKDDYVSRRDFSKFMVLTSLAFAVGQLWIVGRSLWRKAQGALPIRKVASLSALTVGQTLVFSYPGPHDLCVLVRLAEDTLVAYSQKCTHLSCAVVPRPAEGVLHCPCHEGYFDLRTGRVMAGPPPRPLPKILLEVRGDDVFATGVETRTV